VFHTGVGSSGVGVIDHQLDPAPLS
jgi:hypothetical protein